mmetsp:Transcript_120615/g.169700  ORF Transcript_120615/g.169700 Transcript_120615/m.169700 type:complete len:251 (-) Transcript_120615:257-1009(-)
MLVQALRKLLLEAAYRGEERHVLLLDATLHPLDPFGLGRHGLQGFCFSAVQLCNITLSLLHPLLKPVIQLLGEFHPRELLPLVHDSVSRGSARIDLLLDFAVVRLLYDIINVVVVYVQEAVHTVVVAWIFWGRPLFTVRVLVFRHLALHPTRHSSQLLLELHRVRSLLWHLLLGLLLGLLDLDVLRRCWRWAAAGIRIGTAGIRNNLVTFTRSEDATGEEIFDAFLQSMGYCQDLRLLLGASLHGDRLQV